MGCDIHTYVETRAGDGSWEFDPSVVPFGWRSDVLFGWLGDVRNEDALPAIAARRGLPENTSREVRAAYAQWEDIAHSASWVGVEELLAFDYDAVVRLHDGESGTYREFLGVEEDLARLARLGEPSTVRVVFWFDN
ncbi:hypothetical protein [Nocardia otitidiscaviarum]|uniref:hypothetical protein n=1 Tax=Nocardia otitidiscaviarum TaxID=1823 RepID=UPI0011DDDEE0|nr:hypothetical protein [Nocardia otitidiscaviarum]